MSVQKAEGLASFRVTGPWRGECSLKAWETILPELKTSILTAQRVCVRQGRADCSWRFLCSLTKKNRREQSSVVEKRKLLSLSRIKSVHCCLKATSLSGLMSSLSRCFERERKDTVYALITPCTSASWLHRQMQSLASIKCHLKCHVLELYLFISSVNSSFFRVNFTL